MASLLYNGAFATGLSEDESQSTLEPIRNDPSEAELESPPEWNAVETDDSGQLIGLSPRVVGSETDMPERGPLNLDGYDTTREGDQALNNQVASSGTAAAREANGIAGHGTMQTEIGIEPLNPAQVYGNEYFVRNGAGINEGGGMYMTPPDGDNWAQQVVSQRTAFASREARMSTTYANFFAAGGN